MDTGLKKQAERLFEEMGINMTTAINAFIKATVRDGRIPFALVSDEYALKRMIRIKLEESLEQAAKPDAVLLSREEVFGKYREKYKYELCD